MASIAEAATERQQSPESRFPRDSRFSSPLVARIRPVKKDPSRFRTITIVGVGLIGGSLGLAIRRRFPAVRVVGVDRAPVLKKARNRGAITAGESDLSKAVSNADLVILAAPLDSILHLLPTIARLVPPTTIVTDVGSVKYPVVQVARKHFRGNFIGGHPMAGIELSGIEAAHPLLFENAVYVLTPSKNTRPAHMKRLGSFVAGLGARSLVMDARVHDQVASAVSHVPQLTAVALMTMAGRSHRVARKYLGLGAGGFRDLTRIASSRYELWRSILQLNRPEVTRSLDMLVEELRTIRRLLSKARAAGLKQRFSLARRLRQSIPRDMKGFLAPLSAVHVFVPDKPGMLARITALIAKHHLNIKDIELMKIREGTGGTFRLSFDSNQTAARAAAILRKSGFEATEPSGDHGLRKVTS